MRVAYMLLVGAMTVAATGCGDATGLTAEDLEGTWNATQIVYTNQANASESVDIVPLGGSFTMTVTSDGSVSTVFDDGEGSTNSNSGTFSSTQATLTVAGEVFQAVRSGDQLTLTNSDSAYDFDDDGSDDPATLVIRLTRQ